MWVEFIVGLFISYGVEDIFEGEMDQQFGNKYLFAFE
jgi:hypothetical protein